jgi:hypothetical protein
MEILIQSFLEIAQRLNSSIHIRYCDRTAGPFDGLRAGPVTTVQGGPVTIAQGGKDIEVARQTLEPGKKTSWVIIRRPYAYLESVVRRTFEEAEDVKVIVDRRWHERRQTAAQWPANRRKPANDRRRSSPMLDILIDVET